MASEIVPLIINGENITTFGSLQPSVLVPSDETRGPQETVALGATPELCLKAVESCETAFSKWRKTSPLERRALFSRLASLLKDNQKTISEVIQKELGCSEKWALINLGDAIGIAEHIASLVTSGVLSGSVPESSASGSCAVVLKEPLGVVLGIAPWNAPLILGLRAVAAAVAAGNTAILKGSELSARTHCLIAHLFREAGFPPGVVNFLVHKPEDAAICYEAIISHPAVRKCNFTGSTIVGKSIATRAAAHLKPVLLELGGKNHAIVLEDADLEHAAEEVLVGAFLNSGQICMSTDLVWVHNSVKQDFLSILRTKITGISSSEVTKVINSKSDSRVKALVDDARLKGANVVAGSEGATVLENVTTEMDFWSTESFGPLVGVRGFDYESECVAGVNGSDYGLSAAIFTKSHFKGFNLGRTLSVGAVHINAMTVHDEPTLPHGGYKASGYGRFGGVWAFEEFLQTKTIITNP
ncbi:hypothetical protein PFICI_15346 [Pestalotiopsis fici W106-1]|uniref:Aldehyde dehydrogenase domain-containing protein n=1 Tax=Pestalotiopsis fici (strain W106-1 / CGMCC3.15140) TaxID=1229662 RepID=W3WGM3_PESFW|nr:uncharacterized protein PFICI_15346 [Pestalotiopsis fici W106-1]ETS72954.1 hypothetical protein PFICI_15346 [Pestalotiopsis fici W106-1]